MHPTCTQHACMHTTVTQKGGHSGKHAPNVKTRNTHQTMDIHDKSCDGYDASFNLGSTQFDKFKLF